VCIRVTNLTIDVRYPMAAFDFLSTQVTARVLCRPFLYLVPGAWTVREACERLPRPSHYNNWFDFGVVDSSGKVCGTYNTCPFDSANDEFFGFQAPVIPIEDEFSRPLAEEMVPMSSENTIDANASYEECISATRRQLFVVDGDEVLGILEVLEDCLKPVGAAVFLTLILEIERSALEVCLRHPRLFLQLPKDTQERAHRTWWTSEGKEMQRRVIAGNEFDPDWSDEDLDAFMNSDDVISRKILRTMLMDRVTMALQPARDSGRWAKDDNETESLINTLNRIRNGLAHVRVSTVGTALLEQDVAEQIENRGSLYGAPESRISYGKAFAELKHLHDALSSQLVGSDEHSVRTGSAVPADQALFTAQQDAVTAYRDLSPFKIGITLQDDGWHIDYDLANPKMTGGGPHYIIDAETGEIVSKRYEQ
jgi:hypothetical protein